MKTAASEKYLRECLNQAKFYEFCTEADRALTVLSPIWKSIDEPPDIEGLEPRLACEILLVCGGVISYYGQMQQKKSFQETASDLLTRAQVIAEEIGERDIIAESERQIGLAYFRLGQYENAIAYFNTLINRFNEAEQLTETICLGVQTHLLMTHVKNEEPVIAFNLLQKIQPEIENSDDLWLKNTFYNQAAGVHLKAGNFKIAVPFLEKAVEYSQITRNTAFLGNALNNLALVYLTLRDLTAATAYVERAIETYSKLSQPFTLGMALDTKAQIELEKGSLQNALHTIDESVRILEKGENYAYLAESFWTRTRILAKNNDKYEAVRQFTMLMQIVERHLNWKAVELYSKRFTELIYIRSGENFYEQTENFRCFLLDKALAASGGVVMPTAAQLGISHQNTSKLLKKYPEFCEKHRVKLKIRSTDSLNKNKESKKPMPPATVIKLKTDRLKHVGLSKGMSVRFERCPVSRLDLSKPIVIQDAKRTYHCGFLVDAFDMYAFEDGLGNIEATFIESEILDAGQVVAVFDEDSQEFIPLEEYE